MLTANTFLQKAIPKCTGHLKWNSTKESVAVFSIITLIMTIFENSISKYNALTSQ